ncbi:MFS transporter [Nocardia asteroides]|uniref:MFS transporter n=1 Tax=Nocardia asteroides TaxID=1824 RepID=UPI001E540449|nr:MFS transporter [Nocardia asteroides]UGT56880.1 MFS transporter [Nocardia asteroides]
MKTELVATSRPRTPLGTPVVLFLSLAAALGTAAIYPLQPAIAQVAGSVEASIATVGIALAGGPVGYLIGLALLVPLVDRFQPARVLAGQFGVLAVASAVCAWVADPWQLGLLMGIIGACSAVGAGLSSVAARLAPPERRATILGIVTAGISAGILAGRIVGGWLADEIGWRGAQLAFAAACAAVALGCLAVVPTARRATERGYLATLRSLPGLLVRDATLRRASVRGALWFFAFCAVWSGLAVALAAPPFSYSAERIGLYALAGLSGIAATRIAGTWTDRVGPRRVILLGLAVAGVAALCLGVGLTDTVVTLVCLALFDAGLFAAQVANQSTVLAIDPASPARYNSAYMVTYFVGGSLGTAFGAAAVAWFGWTATATIAALATAIAAALVAIDRRPTDAGSPTTPVHRLPRDATRIPALISSARRRNPGI